MQATLCSGHCRTSDEERREVGEEGCKKNEPRYSVYNSFILKDFNFEKVRLSKYKRVCRQNMFLDKYKRA